MTTCGNFKICGDLVSIELTGKIRICCDCNGPIINLCSCDRYTDNPLFRCQFTRMLSDLRNDPFTAFNGTWDRFVDESAEYQYIPAATDDSGQVGGSLDIQYWTRDTGSSDDNLGLNWWPPVSMRQTSIEGVMRNVVSPTGPKQYYDLYYDYSITTPPSISPLFSGFAGVKASCDPQFSPVEDAASLEMHSSERWPAVNPADPAPGGVPGGEPTGGFRQKNYDTEFYSGPAAETTNGGITPQWARVTEASNSSWSYPLASDTHDPVSPVCKINVSADERMMPSGPYATLAVNWGGDVWTFNPVAPVDAGINSVVWLMGGTLYGAYDAAVSSWGQKNGFRYESVSAPNPTGTDIPLYVSFRLSVSQAPGGGGDWTVRLTPDIINKYIDNDGDFPLPNPSFPFIKRRCYYSIYGGSMDNEITDCNGPRPKNENTYTDAAFTGLGAADLTINGSIYRCADGEYGSSTTNLAFSCAARFADTGEDWSASITFSDTAEINI